MEIPRVMEILRAVVVRYSSVHTGYLSCPSKRPAVSDILACPHTSTDRNHDPWQCLNGRQQLSAAAFTCGLLLCL